MEGIGEYKTITASNFENLDRRVDESIQEGFRPFGSPYVTKTEKGTYIERSLVCQAMVRYV